MTKKDYVKLAAALAAAKPAAPYTLVTKFDRDDVRGISTEVWQGTVHNVADVLSADNPRFDRERFLAAAGVR